MYRDFVYLDIDRIQSIIAQLEKGVLEKVLEGRTKELQGKSGIAAGILSSFLPLSLEGTFTRKSEIQHSKVLHDYAYTLALEALEKHRLCFEITTDERNQLPQTPAAFILVKGSATILDYGLIKQLAQNEAFFTSLSSQTPQKVLPNSPPQRGRKVSTPNQLTQSQGVVNKLWSFAEAAMGDGVQIRMKRSEDLLFVGAIDREFLRETTRDFIFKYGGKPQTGWVMLAQIAQITTQTDKRSLLKDAQTNTQMQLDPFASGTDAINIVLEQVNLFQELLASVSFPSIAVTPIAIYRELQAVE